MNNGKTIVVAYDNIGSINNHEHVGYTAMCEGYRIITHTTPREEVVGSKLKKNYDLLITSNASMVGKEGVVFLQRHSKPVQSALLNAAIEKFHKNNPNTKPKFILPRCWDSRKALMSERDSDELKSFIIKLNNGARGIGQFLIRDSGDQNVRQVFNSFNDMLEKFATPEISGAVDTSKNNVSENLRQTIEKLVKEFLPLGTVYSGHDSQDTVLINGTMRHLSNWHIQEFIPNIFQEIRIVTGVPGGTPDTLMVERTIREDRPFPQATGATQCKVITKIESRIACPDTLRLLNELLTNCIGPLQSVDVFIVKDEKTGEAIPGIFEYCNQFGTLGLPIDKIIDIHNEFIVDKYSELCK